MPNNHKNHRKRRRWLLLGVIALALAGGALGIAAALRPNHQIDPSKLASVERGDIARSVVATGKITPLAKVEVKSKASGLVKKIYVEYGDRVKQGRVRRSRNSALTSWRLRPPSSPPRPPTSATWWTLRVLTCHS